MQEHQPHAQPAEAVPTPEQQEQHLKTIAIRVEESVHAQLRFIAQLSGTSITEEIRQAIAQRLATAQDDPELIARAQQAREEIEREAAARTAALAGFMGAKAVGSGSAKVRRSSKPSGE